MNAYIEAGLIETRAMEDIIPFLKTTSLNGQYVLTNKGNLAKELQKTIGDAALNAKDGKIYCLEIKAEVENKYGNFFLETWSNRKWFNPGWMYTLRTDILLYYFCKEKDLYTIDFNKLKAWAFIDGNIYKYPEKSQSKYTQLNDTWGRCVPISVIEESVGFKKHLLGRN